MSEQPERVPFAGDFHVGEWLVEPSLDRLSRNGTVLHLRPQLTNLLVLLARNAGRTVSKDEILSTVWDGQFVAESGMTRCIAEIRQALGDDARDPKIVQTITKRGYRLVAPVTFIEPLPSGPAKTVTVPSGPQHAEDAPFPDAGENGTSPDIRTDLPPAAKPADPRRFLGIVAWSLASTLGVLVVAGLAWGVAGWIPPARSFRAGHRPARGCHQCHGRCCVRPDPPACAGRSPRPGAFPANPAGEPDASRPPAHGAPAGHPGGGADRAGGLPA